MALQRAVTEIFYRSQNTAAFTQLSERHGLEIHKLRGVVYDTQPLKNEIVATLGLAKTVNDANLVTWKHIELCAFNGDTEAARQEGIRLLKKVECYEVDALSRRQTGMAFQENVESQRHGASPSGWEMALERLAELSIGKFAKLQEHMVASEQTAAAQLQEERVGEGWLARCRPS